MRIILKLLGGIQPNYWGDISPIPPGFGTTANSTVKDQRELDLNLILLKDFFINLDFEFSEL